MSNPLKITALLGFPRIEPGDLIADCIYEAVELNDIYIEDNDIFVIAQKIVSKSEGRLVKLSDVIPSPQALELAKTSMKDPRLVELILSESKNILRTRPGTIIVEHKLGFVCANAGIDHSNVFPLFGEADDWVLLLPENPDRSAETIRSSLELLSGKKVGIVIIDSHGRAWRLGTVGVTIGLSGVPGLVDMRGVTDLSGYVLKSTQIAAADELAAAASLMMGQAAEGTPVIHVRGFPYPLREGCFSELNRPLVEDLFR